MSAGLAGRLLREQLVAPRRSLLRLLDHVRRDVELEGSARPDAFLAQAGGQVIVGFREAGALVELPLVRQALPADLCDLLPAHLFADHETVERADVVEVRLQEL